MINKPSNWNNVQAFTDRQKLPIGAYVCTIKKAVVQSNDYGDQLCVLFDISAGEYAGYYEDEFKQNNRDDKKWKGVLRLWLPTNDGSDKDEWTKSILKGFVTSVEESNLGYTWNWDEASLAKKEIGILFRNEEWEYNGKSGWAVRPFRAISVDSVEDGKYTLPNDKPLKREPVPTYDNFAPVEDSSEQLPF